MKHSVIIMMICALCSCQKRGDSDERNFPHWKWKGAPTFHYTEVEGIGAEQGVTRRDPSDVIKVEKTWYVWYTKVHALTAGEKTPIYPEGYFGTIWYATSVDEGYSWEEKGMAISKGENSAWDSFGVFTPNIIRTEGKYFLYYTGVRNGFDNKEESLVNETRIGVAVADSPDGPWLKKAEPVIKPAADDYEKFDSYRVDDACLVEKNGKFYLYYKGRQSKKAFEEEVNTVLRTKMGLAIADRPDGDFTRQNGGNHIQDSGHEVAVWQERKGYYSMASRHGENGNSIWFSENGHDFTIIIRGLINQPNAPGFFRPELTGSKSTSERWGIAIATYEGDPYLHRFTMKFE